MLGLTATSEIRKIVVCGFMLFTTDIEKKHIYFHISSGKTLGAPFANSNLQAWKLMLQIGPTFFKQKFSTSFYPIHFKS